MNIEIGDKMLITTDGWFLAPDGNQYKGVFGTVNAVLSAEETLGIKTNSKSTNWYVSIGNMILAGCQIHYAVKTNEVNLRSTGISVTSGIQYKEINAKSHIYYAD